MTRDESIALFEACEAKRAEARAAALAEGKDEHEARRIAHEAARAHWNAWAEPLLAECKAMEADGRWAAEKDTIGRLVPKNELTRAWMEKAAVLFFRCVFLLRGDGTKDAAGEEEKPDTGAEPPVKLIQLEGDSTDFSGFVFPGSASFKSTHFRSEATFDSTKFERRAEFTGITFKRDVRFFDAAFQGGVWFHSATFEETAYFYRTIFQSEVVFTNAKFQSMAHFQITHFVGNAVFAHTAFRGPAWFFSSTFQGDASFENATFEEEACFNFTQFNAPASFALCDFLRHATFEASRFDAGASFGAIRGERGFNMADAVFKVVPDFIQAHFEEAPRLDNLEVGFTLPELKKIEDEDHAKLGRRGRWHRERLEKNWHYRRLFEAISKDSDLRNIPARFRALKRLAIQSHDTERELEFHAREMRAQRFIEHWPLPWLGKSSVVWKSVLGFWSGLLYGLFSNYGRSLLQPALFWLAGIVLGVLATRVLAFIVYQAAPNDPLVLGGVILAMMGLGLIAAWLPAQRALAVNPTILMREE